MCGIAGCFGIKDTQTINKMLDALPHRGRVVAGHAQTTVAVASAQQVALAQAIAAEHSIQQAGAGQGRLAV